MIKLKKYLLIKYSGGGYPDKSVGNHGEVTEYGTDENDAINRAVQKYGDIASYYRVIGEIG